MQPHVTKPRNWPLVFRSTRLLINGFADQVVDDVGIKPGSCRTAQRLGHDDV